MTSEKNKALIRRLHEAFTNNGDMNVADEIIASDCVLYFAGQSQPIQGPEAFKQTLMMMRSAFPDIGWQIEEMVAEGDKVLEKVVAHATHTGTFMGIPATGRKVTLQGVALFRIADNKIVEDWAMPNLMSLLQQLGAMDNMIRK